MLLLGQYLHWFNIVTWHHLWQWMQHFWFVIPLLAVILACGIDFARKRSFWTTHNHRLPFTHWLDTVVSSFSIAMAGYWLSNTVLFGVGRAPHMPITLDLLWAFSALIDVWLLVRYVRGRHTRTVDNTTSIDMDVDAPIMLPEEDRLDRWNFAKRLATVLTSRDPNLSVVVGVYGPWGSGKTSVLNLMKRQLENDNSDTILVIFNPWYFGTDEQVIQQFFKQLSAEIKHALGDEPSNLSRKLNEYASKISAVTFKVGPLGISLKDPIPWSGKDQTVFELRDEIQSLLNEAGRQIVVLIDDLDRLDQSELQTVFKLVKLIADFPFTSYVLAFDPDVVSSALNEFYAGDNAGSIGASFLEKIIQVPLRLPSADAKLMTQMVYGGLDQLLTNNHINLTKDEAERFGNVWARSVLNVLSTPRMTKRYLNSVSFAIPLLHGEVNTVDQMLLEALRVFFPPVYELIVAMPHLVLSGGKNVFGERKYKDEYRKQFDDNAFISLTVEEVDATKILLQELFPQTSIYWSNTSYGPDWESEWEKQKRVCSQTYFPRYFKYAVPTGDISDVAFTEFIENSPQTVDTEDLKDKVLAITGDSGMPRFVQKLRAMETNLDSHRSEQLARTLAIMGDYFTQQDGFLTGTAGTTWQQAAILISQLVKNIEEDKRPEVSKGIIETADPLTFAREIFMWFRYREKNANHPILQSDDAIYGASELVSRISSEAQTADFLSKYGKGSASLLWEWGKSGSKDEVRETLRRWFHCEGVAENFLELFIPDAVSMETGKRFKSMMEKDNYDSLDSIFPANEFADLLIRKYPLLTPGNDALNEQDLSSTERAVIQFLRLHQAINDSNNSVTEDE